MNPHECAQTVIIDAGVRYGPHPSWDAFKAPLMYYGFEPDLTEVERLNARAGNSGNFEFIAQALGAEEGSRSMRIYRHRGYSSFYELNEQSEWFANYRAGEGALEREIQVQTTTIDSFAKARDLKVDFLKLDTEGSELEILKGSSEILKQDLLGLRVEVSFSKQFEGGALFPEIHQFLLERGFMLLNLDYFGRGTPMNFLFRNPDPLQMPQDRYGVLMGTDGVWIREPRLLLQKTRSSSEIECDVLKLAYFCFLNHAPDVGVDLLSKHIKSFGSWTDQSQKSELFLTLRREYTRYLGRWRVYPDFQWAEIQKIFFAIFGLKLESGNQFWEFLQSL